MAASASPTASSAAVYKRIAERHLMAADVLLAQGLHEVALFHCWHGFESLACAALDYARKPVPLLPHKKKIEDFLDVYRSQSWAAQASELALRLEGKRNSVLYPSPAGVPPEYQFQAQDVQSTLADVKQVGRVILTHIGLIQQGSPWP